ncbi:hypothetical protein D3C84_1290860 [compost metagenome]
MNTSNSEKEIDFQKYDERTAGFTAAKNIISQEELSTLNKTTIPAMKMWVLELKK